MTFNQRNVIRSLRLRYHATGHQDQTHSPWR